MEKNIEHEMESGIELWLAGVGLPNYRDTFLGVCGLYWGRLFIDYRDYHPALKNMGASVAACLVAIHCVHGHVLQIAAQPAVSQDSSDLLQARCQPKHTQGHLP